SPSSATRPTCWRGMMSRRSRLGWGPEGGGGCPAMRLASKIALAGLSLGLFSGASAQAPPTPAVRRPDVIFVPTPPDVVDRMLEMAEVKRGDVVYDLGCGDGRIVVTAARRYGVRAVGIDIDPKRVEESRENVRKGGVAELVTIKQGDIFQEDLGGASVV